MKKYKRIAVYPSVLYGADFIVESLGTVLPLVDHAFVVMMQRPWGKTSGVQYKGEWVPWPERFDDAREKVKRFGPLVTVVEDQKDTPWNRWGYGVNVAVRQKLGVDADEVVVMDPDCVFSIEEAGKTFFEWASDTSILWAAPRQVELWRTPAWQVQRQRQMVWLVRGDLSLLNFPDPPGPPARHPAFRILGGEVHNLGFCVSPATMRWKHLTAMAFSPVIGESIPNPDWYERTWLGWHPVNSNQNLEISLGCEAQIPCAVPYDITGLPESIRERYAKGEWPWW